MVTKRGDLLDYASLAELVQIINASWPMFMEVFRDKTTFTAKMDEIRKWRNLLAHGGQLQEGERIRLILSLEDFDRLLSGLVNGQSIAPSSAVHVKAPALEREEQPSEMLETTVPPEIAGVIQEWATKSSRQLIPFVQEFLQRVLAWPGVRLVSHPQLRGIWLHAGSASGTSFGQVFPYNGKLQLRRGERPVPPGSFGEYRPSVKKLTHITLADRDHVSAALALAREAYDLAVSSFRS